MARAVLIVEDDAAMRELLVSMLSEVGLDARAAGDEEEALELAATLRFDAVLSKVKMRAKGDLALVRTLRRTQPETPVILMTAQGNAPDPDALREAGVLDCLTKPFRRRDLLAALSRAFREPTTPAASPDPSATC